MAAKFSLKARVRKIGNPTVYIVEEIHQVPDTEVLYIIQLGQNYATRVWARESELEPAE